MRRFFTGILSKVSKNAGQAVSAAAKQAASGAGPKEAETGAKPQSQSQGPTTSAARLAYDEALKVLSLTKEDLAKKEMVRQKVSKMYKANNPEKGGSPYVQAKIQNAYELLMKTKLRIDKDEVKKETQAEEKAEDQEKKN